MKWQTCSWCNQEVLQLRLKTGKTIPDSNLADPHFQGIFLTTSLWLCSDHNVRAMFWLPARIWWQLDDLIRIKNEFFQLILIFKKRRVSELKPAGAEERLKSAARRMILRAQMLQECSVGQLWIGQQPNLTHVWFFLFCLELQNVVSALNAHELNKEILRLVYMIFKDNRVQEYLKPLDAPDRCHHR